MITFTVHGLPAAKGNMRAFLNRKTGRPVVTEGRLSSTKPWQQEVAGTARAVFGGLAPFTGPVGVTVRFSMPRLKAHVHPDGTLRQSAPVFHASRPDIDKLARTILDALTGIAYLDDGQVAELTLVKQYASQPGVTVNIEPR